MATRKEIVPQQPGTDEEAVPLVRVEDRGVAKTALRKTALKKSALRKTALKKSAMKKTAFKKTGL